MRRSPRSLNALGLAWPHLCEGVPSAWGLFSGVKGVFCHILTWVCDPKTSL